MKKILIYILIVGILLGNLSAAPFALAQTSPASDTGLGKCFAHAISGSEYVDSDYTFPDLMTHQQCEDEVGKMNASGIFYTVGWTPQGSTQPTFSKANNPSNDPLSDILDTCSLIPIGSGGIWGCIQHTIYALFVSIPGFLLPLAASLFDFFLNLTLSAASYSYDFINNMWGVIRNFSNIFFILILLYAAFQTILGLGHGNGKKMVASVVVIALLVNFSLFFTKVVIDAGNIMGLIFYNKIIVDGNPPALTDSTKTRIKSVSASQALANSFMVEKVFTKDFIGGLKLDKQGSTFWQGVTIATGATLGVLLAPASFGTSLLAGGAIGYAVSPSSTSLTLQSGLIIMGMMVAFGMVSYAMIYAFMVAGLSFLGRTLKLIMLMIVSPFSFVSYAIPKLKGLQKVGFDKWLDGLISSSFSVVIFVFMLYVVSALLKEHAFIDLVASNKEGHLDFFPYLIVIFVPSIIIVMLLLAAAKYSKSASSEFSDRIIGAGKATAGIVIGGAALTTGFAGRTAIGRTSAAISRRDDAKKYGKDLYDWETKGKVGPKPTATSNLGWIGGKINRSQLKSGEVAHAQHEMEELKKKAGIEGLDRGQISGVDQLRLQNEFQKSNRSQIEADIKRGHDDKGRDVTIDKDAYGVAFRTPLKGTDAYIAQRRSAVNAAIESDPTSMTRGDTDSFGKLTDQGRRTAENKLTEEVNIVIKDLVPEIAKSRYKHLDDESTQKIGVGTRLAARSTSGSYDPRNLANIKMGPSMGIGTKAAAGIIAAVATGIRVGLKSGAGVNTGEPKRDVILDLRNTIGEALKSLSVKIDVKADSHGKDDHGTSGGGHH
jgi:hypothetical protein